MLSVFHYQNLESLSDSKGCQSSDRVAWRPSNTAHFTKDFYSFLTKAMYHDICKDYRGILSVPMELYSVVVVKEGK